MDMTERRLRPEVLQFPQPDGSLDMLDLLMDRFHRFSAQESQLIQAGDDAIWERLAALFITEGDIAKILREEQHSARVAGQMQRANMEDAPPVDWDAAAATLDEDVIADVWRAPERLRRTADEYTAGRHVLILRDFFKPHAAARLRAEALSLPFKRLSTEIVQADRCWLQTEHLPDWQQLFQSQALRTVLGGLLGNILPPPQTTINVWRMNPTGQDHMRAHLDGRRYAATFSVGLCDHWTASQGGAIAFGHPTPQGFLVRERWLPYSGDLCLFRPREALWHGVEPTFGQTPRLTLTGWWMA